VGCHDHHELTGLRSSQPGVTRTRISVWSISFRRSWSMSPNILQRCRFHLPYDIACLVHPGHRL